MKKMISAMAILALVIFAGSCGKDKSGQPDGQGNTGNEWKGIGPSLEKPAGTPFQLPNGIQLAASRLPAYDRDECACDREDVLCHRGSGDLVSVCIGFTNTTNQTITVTIPEGLIIVSFSDETQNGVIIQVETFEVPANSTTYYSVGAYCLNADRSPSYTGDEFELGPVTQNAKLRELINLLRTKRIANTDDSDTVQGALWSITDGNGLTGYDRQSIAALPNR